jgi:hypothetical protein
MKPLGVVALIVASAQLCAAFEPREVMMFKDFQFVAPSVHTTATSDSSDFVLLHYYDVKDCSSEEIEYVAYKTGECYSAGNGYSTRWMCDAGLFQM